MKVEWVPLGKLLSRTGAPIPVDPTAVYPTLGVKSHGRGAFDSGTLQGAQTAYATLTQLREGWVVYPKLMAWEGALALVPSALDQRWVTPEFVAYDITSDALSREYLRHLVVWGGFIDWVRAGSAGTNVRRRRLQPSAFEAIHIPLPSRADQDRIAAHLARLAPTQESSKPTVGISTVRAYAYEKLIRSNAQLTKLREIITPRSPEPLDPGASYPIGGVFGFARGIIQRPALTGAETQYLSLTMAREHDVVYSKLKAFEGAVAVVGSRDSGRYFSAEFPVFEQTAPGLVPGFLEQVLLSPQILRDLALRSTGIGARRERVHPGQFLDLAIPLPDTTVQESVVRLAGQAKRADAAAGCRDRLEAALLPAARNEVFSAMR